MHFFSFVASALAVAVPTVFSSTVSSRATLTAQFGVSYGKSSHYGAPIAHGKPGSSPGWYYGDHPDHSVIWLKDNFFCGLLDLLPLSCLHCPGHGHGGHGGHGHGGHGGHNDDDDWKPTFTNFTCAIQASDYLTYGLVDTVDDCKTMCDNVDDCVFFNIFHDNNAKDGSTQLTCSLFSQCHDQSAADNCGGQTQPDGSVNFITQSAGYCKD